MLGEKIRKFSFFKQISDSDFFLKLHGIPPFCRGEFDDVVFLQFPPESKEALQCKLFQQHSGTGISSRLAEDILYRRGIIGDREFIDESSASSTEQIKRTIAKAHGPKTGPDDVMLTSSGANAFFSIFRTAIEHSSKKGKKIWIRLGWLYLDTIEAMELFVDEELQIISINSPKDLSKLKSIFKDFGEKIAGVVTELPTNPLLQSFDIEAVKGLCEANDALLIVDPTMASPQNVKITDFADVVVNSLTKYANWEGDVMMGCLVFPKSSARGRELMLETEKNICFPFERDLRRLAAQMPFYEQFVKETNSSTLKVADFLKLTP